MIEKLRKKVNAIKENKDRLGGKVDYETNLLIMEDFNMEETNYSDIEDDDGKQLGQDKSDDITQNDDNDDKKVAEE